MEIISNKYFDDYRSALKTDIEVLIQEFDFSDQRGTFDYLTKASAVYSANIEGNSLDLNSFMNYELNKDRFKGGKEVAEIEDLISAYNFAQSNELTEKNFLHTHALCSKSLLIKSKRGHYRVEPVGVFGPSSLVYMAVEPDLVAREMHLFFNRVESLLNTNLSAEEVFYYAAFLHLRFVHIHPFRDGNGRVARLLEKWFIAQCLGEQFWKIPSESMYKTHQQAYYDYINLGVNFYELQYDRCLNFLLMLPKALEQIQ